MGCDIHLYVEKYVDGQWKSADTWKQDEDDSCPSVPYEKRFYAGRNYDLFSILADVRNGYGFAGVDTGSGFIPISEPRGLPKDVSPEVKALSERWGADGHSHSYFTVSELLAYDWTKTTMLRGFLSAHQFWLWSRYKRGQGESPEGWCGGIGGLEIQHVSEFKMKSLLEPYGISWNNEEKIKTELRNYYCKCEWKQTYNQTTRYFWSDCIPRLLALGKQDEVRIVFFFDS